MKAVFIVNLAGKNVISRALATGKIGDAISNWLRVSPSRANSSACKNLVSLSPLRAVSMCLGFTDVQRQV